MRVSFNKILGAGIAVVVILFGGLSMAAEQPAVADAQVDTEFFKKEIERLKNEKDFAAKQIEEMRQERADFVKEIRRMEMLNSKYTKDLEDTRAAMVSQEKTFEARMKKLETQVEESVNMKPKVSVAAAGSEQVVPLLEVEKKANEVLMKGGDLDPEDEKFKEELARAHYNMGNVYFERGEYQRAAVEYYQAVDLMPYDADAHYNLAFVSGEYVGDQPTALKHYQWYLYLKPKAEDRKLIEEKIVNAKMNLRGRLETTNADKHELSGHTNLAR